MTAQRQIPGGPFLDETGTAQRQIPGGPFVNETAVLGTIYYVVYLNSVSDPTKAQIVSGMSWGSAQAAGSLSASATDTYTFPAITTLGAGDYRISFVYVGTPVDSDVVVSGIITVGSSGTVYDASQSESSSSADTQEATWADVPVLSNPGAIDILALSARPQVTVTY